MKYLVFLLAMRCKRGSLEDWQSGLSHCLGKATEVVKSPTGSNPVSSASLSWQSGLMHLLLKGGTPDGVKGSNPLLEP